MKTKLFSLVWPLWVVTALFMSSHHLMAQCNSQATVYATSQNIAYCASGTCSTVNLSIDMGSACSAITTPFTMEAVGGIELAGTNVPTRSGNVFTIGVKAKAGNICKGRLIFRYWLNTDPCNDGSNYPVENVRYIDVYKSGLTSSVLNAWYSARTNLGAPTRIITETPPCITPNDVFLLAVLPVFESCTTDNIGLDEIRWEAPTSAGTFSTITQAGDGSEVTYRAPTSNLAQSNVFGVYFGKAASTPTVTCTLRRAVQRTYILASGFTSGLFTVLNHGAALPVATACLPINRGGSSDNFTLTCEPDEGAGSGATYLWTIPQGYTTSSSLTGRSIVVTPTNRNTANDLGQSGTFTCVTNASDPATCGGSVAQFVINRGLTATSYTPPGGTAEDYNAITVTPAPGAGPSQSNCFTPGTTYTFTLGRPPLNTTLTWTNTSVSATESYWEVVSRPNQWTIALRPVFVNNDFDLPLSVKTTTTCTGQEIFFKAGGLDPRVAGTNLTFGLFPNDASNNVEVRGNISPATLTASWPAVVGGAGCQAADYHYTWEFLNGFGPGANSTTPCNTACFFSISSGNGLNSPNVPDGIYTGTIRVTIKTRTSSAPACSGANCFFQVIEQAYNNFQFRPSGGDSGDATTSVAETPTTLKKALVLSPNPAQNRLNIRILNMKGGGRITIYNGQQVPVRSLDAFESGGEIKLSGLPAGLYLVNYQSRDGKSVTAKLMVE